MHSRLRSKRKSELGPSEGCLCVFSTMYCICMPGVYVLSCLHSEKRTRPKREMFVCF
jgi:hypothetical protein